MPNCQIASNAERQLQKTIPLLPEAVSAEEPRQKLHRPVVVRSVQDSLVSLEHLVRVPK